MLGKGKKSLQVSLTIEQYNHLKRLSEVTGLTKSQIIAIMVNKGWNQYVNEEVKKSPTKTFTEGIEELIK